jgi:hypothetical protein
VFRLVFITFTDYPDYEEGSLWNPLPNPRRATRNRFTMIFPLLAVMTPLLSGCVNGRVTFLRPAGATHMPTIESTTDLQALI